MQCYKFKKQCEESEKILRSYVEFNIKEQISIENKSKTTDDSVKKSTSSHVCIHCEKSFTSILLCKSRIFSYYYYI